MSSAHSIRSRDNRENENAFDVSSLGQTCVFAGIVTAAWAHLVAILRSFSWLFAAVLHGGGPTLMEAL